MYNLIKVRRHSVAMRKIEKWADPRCLQIDLDADLVDTTMHPDQGIHSNRVMPMVNFDKFCRLLAAKTKTFKDIDASHFWVSGYYAIYFYLKDRRDRMKIKRLVKEAIRESGGFMTFESWYKEHQKKHTVMLQYNGTGSGITQTMNTTRIAFL